MRPTWTVYHCNETAPSLSRFVGTFPTLRDAEDYAERQAERSRAFMAFEVWTGTPKAWGKYVGITVQGSHP